MVVTATITSLAWILAGALLFTRQLTPGERAGIPERSSSEAAASPNGAAPRPGRLIIPVQGVRADQLVDTWGQSRDDGARAHEAIDIMAPAGTPIVAAGAGTVEKLFLSEAGGNTIYVRAADRRTIHYYAHLQAYAAGLAEGQAVRRGQRLGTVGSTGNADPAAPHLHFAILRVAPEAHWWEPTTAVDPFPLLRSTE